MTRHADLVVHEQQAAKSARLEVATSCLKIECRADMIDGLRDALADSRAELTEPRLSVPPRSCPGMARSEITIPTG